MRRGEGLILHGKRQRHDVVLVKVPCTYDAVCIFLTCSVYASCVKNNCDLQTYSW